MVAALYDQSLDAYLPHTWPAGFGVFRQDWSRLTQQFENMAEYLNQLQGNWPVDQKNVQITYRTLPASITTDLWGYDTMGLAGAKGRMMLRDGGAMAPWLPGPRRRDARRGDGTSQDAEPRKAGSR